MTELIPKFHRENPEDRRIALIKATLDIIGKSGPRGATVRAITAKANVTQGLIRHHFETKDELLCAAFEYHMTSLTMHTAASLEHAGSNPLDRLRAFVVAALSEPVVDGSAVFLWAGFINMAQTNAKIRAVHTKTYLELRNLLEGLISDAFAAQNCAISDRHLRSKTIACTAVLDGLWLEGGAFPEQFDPDQILEAGQDAIEGILGFPLGPAPKRPTTNKD